MRELYNEDPANHVGPESCVGDPRGRSEALTGGVRAGLLSRETRTSSGCRRSSQWRKAILPVALVASRWWTLRGRRSQARTTSSMRENREIPRLPAGVDDAPSGMVRGVADRCLAGREGNAKAVIP